MQIRTKSRRIVKSLRIFKLFFKLQLESVYSTIIVTKLSRLSFPLTTRSSTERLVRWPHSADFGNEICIGWTTLEATLAVDVGTPVLGNRRDRNAQCTVDYCHLIAFLRFSFARLYLVPFISPIPCFTSPRNAVHIRRSYCMSVVHGVHIYLYNILSFSLSLSLSLSCSLLHAHCGWFDYIATCDARF